VELCGALEVGLVAALVAVVGLVTFALGFVAGARARQIVAAAKVLGQAMVRLVSLKVPASDEDEGENTGDADDEVEGDAVDAKNIAIDDFLNTDAAQDIEEHPDVFVNPVIMYHIKTARETRKDEKRRADITANLELEGYSAEQIAERLREMQENGFQSVGGGVKYCALQVLIDNGAQVEGGAGSGNAEAIALQDRKRTIRNVEAFLRVAYDVRTDKASAKKRDANGRKMETALEVAKGTATTLYGGSSLGRSQHNVFVAKSGRNILRGYKVRQDFERKARGEMTPVEENSDGEVDKPAARRGGRQLNADDLLRLTAELGSDNYGEEGEEGFADDLPVKADQLPPA